MTLLQLVLNGMALGAAYALVALGFVLVLNATGAVNFAQGDLVMAGGYASAALAAALPLPGLALLPVVIGAMALLGLLVAGLAYFPLMRRPATAVFVSTIAIGLVLQNAALNLFGPEPRTAPPVWDSEPLRWGGLMLSSQALAVIGIAAVLVSSQAWLLARTRVGRNLRATAQDRDMAAALAGAAGALLANQFFVTPTTGGALILKAYIAVVIGGWGSLAGAVVGALLVGLFETVVAAAVSYTAASVLLYAALLVILLLRPQGLFGEAAGRRA